MAKIKVGVAGYGTIGQRLADGVAMHTGSIVSQITGV